MHILPTLPYDFSSLEPVIDEATMKIHHGKHHQKYIDNLNGALANYPDLQNKTVEALLLGFAQLPEEIKTTVKNNGGGHANHSLFWQIMTNPKEDNKPESDSQIGGALSKYFDSFDNFKQKFTETALAQFGSGWAFLVVSEGGLKIVSTPNQDSPLMTGDHPILGLDVWEHAYYLKYQNKRPDYVANFCQVINWSQVEKFFKNYIK
ncbi:MAG: superoxide dismutase [Candidatus Paceibacterota bacterium]